MKFSFINYSSLCTIMCTFTGTIMCTFTGTIMCTFIGKFFFRDHPVRRPQLKGRAMVELSLSGITPASQKMLVPITIVESADADAVGCGGMDKHAVVEVDSHMRGLAMTIDEKHEVALLQLAPPNAGYLLLHISDSTGQRGAIGGAEHMTHKGRTIHPLFGSATKFVGDAHPRLDSGIEFIVVSSLACYLESTALFGMRMLLFFRRRRHVGHLSDQLILIEFPNDKILFFEILRDEAFHTFARSGETYSHEKNREKSYKSERRHKVSLYRTGRKRR